MKQRFPLPAALALGLVLGAAAGARAEPLSPRDIEARRAALLDAAADGGTASAQAMIRLAEGAEGELLAAVGRALVPLGDRAVPALIEARGPGHAPATRAWATDRLELLGKRTPGDAVQMGDRALLCEVLRAYGEVKDTDALPAVVAFVGAARSEVREAARAAVLAYGELATRRLRETYAAHTGERADPGLPAAALAHAVFDACDRERLHGVDALFDRGLAAQRGGRSSDAVASFDAVIAAQPEYARRAEAAPAYVAHAAALASADRDRAAAYLEKAVRLDPAGPTASAARSQLALLAGQALHEHGLDDARPFVHALALDPTNGAARAALDGIRAEGDASRGTVRAAGRWSVALGLALAAAAILRLVARRSRRRA